jgi:hypothetical protein
VCCSIRLLDRQKARRRNEGPDHQRAMDRHDPGRQQDVGAAHPAHNYARRNRADSKRHRPDGVADLIDSLPQLDPQGLAESVQFHSVPSSEQASAIANGWLFPWLIVNARRLSSPVPYFHPSGAVTWVNLDSGVTQSITRARQGSRAEPALAAGRAAPSPAPPRPAQASTMHDAAALEPDRRGGTEARISPALEAELVATADARRALCSRLISDGF